jgi:hypothetical protein
MLIADVLNPEATLNDFDVIKTVEFIAGYEFKLVMRLKQPHSKLRYVPASGATLQAHLPKKDGTHLAVAMTPLADDRSIWSATISAANSEEIYGGNFTFELTEGPKVTAGFVENGLALVVTGAC